VLPNNKRSEVNADITKNLCMVESPSIEAELVTKICCITDNCWIIICQLPINAKQMQQTEKTAVLKFLDLFCGIGGFRIAAKIVCQERNIEPVCVFSSDIDADAQKSYAVNFQEKPAGDITKIDASDIPEHDILFAGFPCQPFSICGFRILY
jgi:hypothetical protein